MDLSRLLQVLRDEREGQFGLRPAMLLRALKQMIGQGSRTRRNSNVQTLDRPESLEVRQVLSAVSLVEYSAPLIAFEETVVHQSSAEQGPSANDHEGVLFPSDAIQSDLRPDDHVVQMVRNQLLKSLSPSNLIPGISIPDEIVQVPKTESNHRVRPGDAVQNDGFISTSGTNIEVIAPELIDVGLSAPAFSVASDQFHLSFVIEYNDGPHDVTVEPISSKNLQIRVSGLAGTIFESSGAEFTTRVLYENAIAALQRVQQTHLMQIVFPATSLTGRDRNPSDRGASATDRIQRNPETGPSSAVLDIQSGFDGSESLTDSLTRDVESQATVNSTADHSSLIDQVFAVSELTLDTSILVRSGVAKLQQTLAWAETDSRSAILQQQEVISAAAELKHEPEAAPSSIAVTSQGGLAKLVRRGLRWLRPGRLPAASLVRDAVFSEFITKVSADSAVGPDVEVSSHNSAAEAGEWLSWLLRSSSNSNSPSGIGEENGVYRVELVADPVPVFSNAICSSRDMRGASNAQAQIRKYREQHRHAGGQVVAVSIALYEHDSPRVPQSTSIPRELKYVANPRGPPVYRVDADVPLLEVDAPADLLERLRYSIAPRGPSLATVETQSPDFTFSSGPRMSPEEVSTELAI